jgi:hypothetical protein
MQSEHSEQQQPRRWNGRDLIEVLRGALEKVKSDGSQVVSVTGLENFLSTAEKNLQHESVPPEVIEQAKMVHAANLAAYEAHDYRLGKIEGYGR